MSVCFRRRSFQINFKFTDDLYRSLCLSLAILGAFHLGQGTQHECWRVNIRALHLQNQYLIIAQPIWPSQRQNRLVSVSSCVTAVLVLGHELLILNYGRIPPIMTLLMKTLHMSPRI